MAHAVAGEQSTCRDLSALRSLRLEPLPLPFFNENFGNNFCSLESFLRPFDIFSRPSKGSRHPVCRPLFYPMHHGQALTPPGTKKVKSRAPWTLHNEDWTQTVPYHTVSLPPKWCPNFSCRNPLSMALGLSRHL